MSGRPVHSGDGSISVERLLIVTAVVVLLAGSVFDLYEFNNQAKVNSSGTISSLNYTNSTAYSTTGYVTGTSMSEKDTFLNMTLCPPPGGGGGFGLRVVSDSTGVPVSGETVNAVMTDVCIPQGASVETEVLYLPVFAAGPGGWLTPDIGGAYNVGDLNFTVGYQGRTYNFYVEDAFPPLGNDCVTLHVPSGNITKTSVSGECGS